MSVISNSCENECKIGCGPNFFFFFKNKCTLAILLFEWESL